MWRRSLVVLVSLLVFTTACAGRAPTLGATPGETGAVSPEAQSAPSNEPPETPEATTEPNPTATTQPVDAASAQPPAEALCPAANDGAAGSYAAGTLALQAGDSALAEAHYRQALEQDPAYCDAMVALGQVLVSLGQAEEAVEWYQRSLEIHPKDTIALIGLGDAYLALGQPDEAISPFQQVIQLKVLEPGGYLGLGQSYYMQERYDKAITYLRTAESNCRTSNSPLLSEAQRLLGMSFFYAAQYDQALVKLLAASGAHTNDGELLAAIGVCYLYGQEQNILQANMFVERARRLNVTLPDWVLQDLADAMRAEERERT